MRTPTLYKKKLYFFHFQEKLFLPLSFTSLKKYRIISTHRKSWSLWISDTKSQDGMQIFLVALYQREIKQRYEPVSCTKEIHLATSNVLLITALKPELYYSYEVKKNHFISLFTHKLIQFIQQELSGSSAEKVLSPVHTEQGSFQHILHSTGESVI